MSLAWTKFFWADWESDPALRLCSYSAQGLWMRMLCIASAHDPIGYVAVAGRALDTTAIARMTGGSEGEVQTLLDELDRNGVFSRDRTGRIYSRRMVRDARKAAEARKFGKRGGNPSLCQDKEKPQTLNPPVKAPLKPQKPEATIPDKNEEANASFVAGKPSDEVRIAFDEWNALATRLGLPLARKLDEARRRAIRLRLADGGLEAWREALAAVEASDHCRGENDRGWRADLDFVCTASKFRRLIEGAYGSPISTGPPSDFARHAPLRDAPTLDELRARLDAEIGPVQ
jgi:hypothetical protein